MNELPRRGAPSKSAAVYLQQRALCLDHALDLVSSAERVRGDDNEFLNIVYHLSILALEEIGKAGMLGARASVGEKLHSDKLVQRMDDHVYKLMWAVWSPSMAGGKLDPRDFEEARQFAERTHARRLAGLYVDHTAINASAPRAAVLPAHATSVLDLARTRLELENARGAPELEQHSEDLEWYLATVSDELGAKRLFSKSFLDKHEEFAGDTRAWIQWARREFAEVAAQEKEHLQRELARQPGQSEHRRPKWLIKVVLKTPSHAFRQKTLNHWNDRIEPLKLHIAGAKGRDLLLEMSIDDSVTLEQLFDVGLAASKRYAVMLSIGCAGVFWYELSGQTETYYESIRDLDAPGLVPHIFRPKGLAREWATMRPDGAKRDLAPLKTQHLENVMKCLAAFGPMPDHEAAPIFGLYLQGLTLLCKSDMNLSLEIQARAMFLAALRHAMIHFKDWNGVEGEFLSALRQVMAPVVPQAEHQEILLASLTGNADNANVASDAVAVKRILDLYLLLVAVRQWPAFVKSAAARSSHTTVEGSD
jgi:AbiV family abortive infection protein